MPKPTCPNCQSKAKPCNVRTTRTLATEYECSDCQATIERSGLGTITMLLGTVLNFALMMFNDRYLSGQPLTLISLILLAGTLIGLGFYWMRPKVKTPAMQAVGIRNPQS